MTTLDRTLRNALAALQPPPVEPLAEWIEGNLHLPSVASAEPGRVRLYAYQRGICEILSDPDVREVVISKSARVGFTMLLGGLIAHAVATQPGPILATQPTTDDSRSFAVDIEMMFESSPALRGLLSLDQDETGRSTLMRRLFAGGSLEFLSASSPRAFRRKLGKLAIADEIDAYPPSEEGSILDLLKMRTQTYRDRKLVFGGTPIFDYGPVTTLYEASSRHIFEPQCPSCGERAEILFGDIRWADGDPESAHWVCPRNGCVVTEDQKASAVEAGRWRATAPAPWPRVGLRLNALVSPHYNNRWSAIVAEFLESKKSPERLQTFTNLVLGQPWKTEGEELDHGELYSRREPFGMAAIPAAVLWLTVGVDCQDDRLEAVILGHSDSEIFVLDHRVFWGKIDGDSVWHDLDSLLRETWQHQLGGRIGISAAAVDSGSGGHTEIVHRFTGPRYRRRTVSLKGVGGFARPFLEKSGSGLLWIAGVDALKSALFARLSRGDGIRFGDALSPTYFEQLTSERRVMRYKVGQPVARFERHKGMAAECLDATCYAWAARSLIGQSPDMRREELASSPVLAKPVVVARSKWLEAK